MNSPVSGQVTALLHEQGLVPKPIRYDQSKKISNDQEQSDPTSCLQNQKGNN